MKKFTFAFMAIVFLAIVSCGPSAEEQERQRVEDSLKLEKDRIELLEKAGLIIDSAMQAVADSDSISLKE